MRANQCVLRLIGEAGKFFRISSVEMSVNCILVSDISCGWGAAPLELPVEAGCGGRDGLKVTAGGLAAESERVFSRENTPEAQGSEDAKINHAESGPAHGGEKGVREPVELALNGVVVAWRKPGEERQDGGESEQ